MAWSRYGSRSSRSRSSDWSPWPEYVPVGERRAKAAAQVNKMASKGHKVAPVVIEGSTIAHTVWGKAWCKSLESHADLANRLGRGRSYVRHGCVVDLQPSEGLVTALISGSSLYHASITFTLLPKARWQKIVTACRGHIRSLVELLQGKLSTEVMAVVSRPGEGLFPEVGEMKMRCSCPDGAWMCKHLAAVLYGIGHRLDQQPELLFKLRGVDPSELIAAAPLPTLTADDPRSLGDADLSALFGVALDDATGPASQLPPSSFGALLPPAHPARPPVTLVLPPPVAAKKRASRKAAADYPASKTAAPLSVAEPPATKPTSKVAVKPTSQSAAAKKPAKAAVSKPVKTSVSKPVKTSASKPVKTASKPVKTASKPTKAARRSAKSSASEPATVAASKPTKATKKAAIKPAKPAKTPVKARKSAAITKWAWKLLAKSLPQERRASVPDAVPARRPFLERLLGTRPGRLPLLLVPTAFVVLDDLAVRGRLVATSNSLAWSYYGLGVGLSAAVWLLTLWLLARLTAAEHTRLVRGLAIGWLLPVALATFAVEGAYFHYAGTYSSANTLPIAWRLPSSVLTALRGSWSTLLPGAAVALVFVAGLVALARRLAAAVASAGPQIPLVVLTAVTMLCVADQTWTHGVSPLPPDASLIASVVGGLAQRHEPRGLTVRTPLPVPPLTPSRRRSVVLVVSESVRADVLASSRDPAHPTVLDEVIGDRISLGLMTSQASSTIISCVATWTGLSPAVDVLTAHQAPLLFEVARAAGYRTAYVGAQRGDFQRLGVFLQNAGLDVHIQGEDLDPRADVELGAPDNLATTRALAELRAHPEPTLLVLHLSATHYPYRVDPAITPFLPMATTFHEADRQALFNRYRNGVALQERILRDFFAELRTLPSFDQMALLFVSDHGEQFHEHGAFTHIRSLHDEELRVPGFLVAGPHGLDEPQRQALGSFAGRRVFNQDVWATLLDLLGVWEERAKIPLAELRAGRSLVRPAEPPEPVMLLANRNGVWETDRTAFGAMQGARKVMGTETSAFECYDTASDPGEKRALPASACGEALAAAKRAFPFVPGP